MRVLSGIQTTGQGELHIGNYLGAVKHHIIFQEAHEAYYMLANLHAITLPIQPAILRENVYKIAALYLALGLDPNKATLFVQSMVPEHAELTWILNCLAYMGEMRRMTQFKEKAGGDLEAVSVGLFDYPVLMAADILLYQPQLVPVGEDQKQHVELTRNLAERFNSKYGHIFTIPDLYIPDEGARIMGLDNPNKKMSKSHGSNNYIGLLDNPDLIREKLKRAVTDSEDQVRFDRESKPGVSNLLVIFSGVTGKSVGELEEVYVNSSYSQFKNDLTEVLIDFLVPVQEKYREISVNRSSIDALLLAGSEKAKATAAPILKRVKQKIGLL